MRNLILLIILFSPITASGQMETLRQASPQMLSQGKTLYDANCMICHGASGRGDGVAGAGLNPKPRNFVEADWKNGGSPSQLFKTISDGFNTMPSFASLSVADRWALVHYVRSFNGHNPEDTPETLVLLKAFEADLAPKVEIPVEFIIERMAE